MSKSAGPVDMAAVRAALGVIMLGTFVTMLLSDRLMALLRKTGANVIARVSGVLLAALAMQFIFDGLSTSGLFR
jgi:multiple antibiotic resistance protein